MGTEKPWASSVLGFVNQTDHRIGGIEDYYDKTLYGTAGQSMSEKTSSRQEIFDDNSSIEPTRTVATCVPSTNSASDPVITKTKN